jgi:hypothetical protein
VHFTNEKISATPFVPRSDVFFGDYIGISAFAGHVRPLWMRLDGTTLSLWTALIDRPTSDVTRIEPARGGIEVMPNPVRETGAVIVFRDARPGPVHLAIHDAAGRLVCTLSGEGDRSLVWDGRTQDGRVVPAGVYFISGEKIEPARIVVLR